MTFSVTKFFFFCILGLASPLLASSQELARALTLGEGSTIEIINKSGKVGVTATATGFGFTASSAKGVAESEIKVISAGGRTQITVNSTDRQKRIDLVIKVPERSTVKVETAAGAVDVSGNFAVVEAKTDTGTISMDVPDDELRYHMQWTESRPRYLADFDLAPVKEKSAGRFEIKGLQQNLPADDTKPASEKPADAARSEGTPKQQPVSLILATARGIILLNVPPNEVMSDLRERPLTNAARSIIRSGDSLLMEAIRRASPKYFGDYARTLPPLRLEPTFSVKGARGEGFNAEKKTAVVRVTDIKNRSIPGLTASDFEVTENGSLREIISVDRSEAPFNLVLLLDVSGSVENYVNFIRKAARNFVDTVGSDDRVAIVIFNEDVKLLSTFTKDKGALSESLDTFDAGGGTAYYDALAYTIADTLRPLKGERTAIVILTDGDDNRSFLAFDSLAGSIQESGALIYPLYVPSALIALGSQNINADIDPLRKKYMALTAKSEGEGEKLAQISGGVYYPITQIGQIQKAYEDIVLQMRSAYNVTFRSSSEPGGNGASPKLKVRTKRENVFATVTSVTAAK